MSIYTDNGYENRKDYLEHLAENQGVDIDTVLVMADLLGPNEDFDGLVTSMEDYAWTMNE
ncbi:MAG: RNA polymerase [Gammaproteobacteria bacterium]|nr:RNA polymerase [Gammaproteobacteria bacterium]